MSIKTLSAFVLGALLLAGSAWADSAIYKWVDDKGVVHYSTEPHGDNAQQTNIINSGNSLPNPSTAPPPASATGPATAPGDDDATLEAPLQADSPACKAAREQLARYLQASSLYQINNGQKRTLTAQERAITLDVARLKVHNTCSPGGGS